MKMIKETLKKCKRRIKMWPIMLLKKGHNWIKYKLIKDMTWELSWGKYNSECIDLKGSLHSRINQ